MTSSEIDRIIEAHKEYRRKAMQKDIEKLVNSSFWTANRVDSAIAIGAFVLLLFKILFY